MTSTASRVIPLVIFLLVMASTASGTTSDMNYVSSTTNIVAPIVILAAGNSGSSSVTLSSSAATSAAAGIVYYDSAVMGTNPGTSCTVITSDTSTTAPGAGTSTGIAAGSAGCLWVQFASATTIYKGNWTIDFYASDGKNTAFNLNVYLYITSSTGTVQSTLINNVPTGAIPKTLGHVGPAQFAGSSGTVPAGGYLELVFANPTGAGRPTITVYWGSGQQLRFFLSTYDYVLKIQNPSSNSYLINLGVASSSVASKISNLTLWFHSPTSAQIALGSGVTQQTTGPQVTLAGSTTMYIALYALESTNGATTTTVTLSLKVQTFSGGPYAQYTIALTVY